MEVGGQSVGGQSGSWRVVGGCAGLKLEVSLWVGRVEVGGQSVGGQGGGWRSVCMWTGWRLEVSLWVDRVEVGGQSVVRNSVASLYENRCKVTSNM